MSIQDSLNIDITAIGIAEGGRETYAYDCAGIVIASTDANGNTIRYAYNSQGKVCAITDQSGNTLYYAYAGDGRLQYLRDSADGTAGRETAVTGGSIAAEGSTAGHDTNQTEYRYTDAGRIKEIITTGGIKTGYNYDEDGNISRLTIGDGTEDGLLYDDFMLYDLNGNRTGKNGARLGITSNREKMSVTYRYDLLNRQTYVRTLDGREQENLYDGEGLRAGLTENGKKSTFLYHNGEILTEFDGEGVPVRRYLRGVG